MFHLFRSRKQTFRIVLAIIVAPVIITMVVTLIPGIGGASSGSGADAVVAEVDGEEITVRDAQYQIQDFIKQQRVPPEALGFLAPTVVQNLVTDKLMEQEAKRQGLGVTEEELADTLRTNLPFLFQGGSFLGKDQYAAFVQERFQKSIPEFEMLVRKDLGLTKLKRLVTDGVVVTQRELEEEYKRRGEKAKIEYVQVSSSALLGSVESTQAELEEHFKQNRASYPLPERRSFRYMAIDDARVQATVEIKPQEIQRYYNENRDRYRVQERARVTHILLKTTEKKDDEIKKIEAKAHDLLKQVRAGKDFAELAKGNSEDTVSAEKGGEVGWITRGQTVPEFEHKAFSMKPGETSDVVKTQYGLHILKLLERETARQKPFAEVEGSIREELARERTQLERSRLADRARAAASRHGVNLEAAGKEVGLEVLTAALVEKGSAVAGVGAEPAVTDAAFGVAKGAVFGPIQTAAKSVIGVVTEIVASRQGELKEVLERVRADANTAKSRQVAEERARQLAAKAKASGGDLRRAARELQLEVKVSEPFTREGSVPGMGAASTVADAFKAAVGTVSGPSSSGADQIVYKLIERIPADMAAFEQDKKSLKESVLGNRQSEAFEMFKEELRERLKKAGKVKIHQDRVDRLMASWR